MTKNSVEHIIRKFGSQRVAELLEASGKTAVSGWVRRGAIPARRQEELLQIADARASTSARPNSSASTRQPRHTEEPADPVAGSRPDELFPCPARRRTAHP